MKQILALFIFLNTLNAFSQTGTKGVKPLENQQTFSENVKMVVIGVSKYQNIQSLNFAHTDALSFYNYMISKQGGNIDTANAKIILNENATAINIYAALDWLLSVTKENETVIFYFSGHGDLENKTLSQQGFLLANDSPKAAYMAGGTIGVFYLQQYLNTLVQKNKARIILISDACRSGKLAGGIEGTSSTTAALQVQQENTVKILSSQPGELSYEGKQWNNGGGVFTYYLVKGLMGFADRNIDNKITLNELNIYLNDNIPRETNFAQNPSINGNPSTVLGRVDSIYFASIKNQESNLKIDNSLLAQRGFEDNYKKTLDSVTYKKYMDFRYCVSHHFLLKPDKKHGSAWDIYQELRDDKKAVSISNTMKSALLSALQEKYQISYKCVLSGSRPPDSIPRLVVVDELKHALELIDTTYIIYNHLVGAYNIGLIPIEEKISEDWLVYCNRAISYEPENPIAYYFLGKYKYVNNKFEEAITNYRKALSLAPTWSWPMISLVGPYRKLNQMENAILLAQNAISHDSKRKDYYFFLTSLYIETNQLDKVNPLINFLDSLCSSDKDAYNMGVLGSYYINYPILKNREKAKSFYEKSIDMKPIKEICFSLGNIYKEENNKEKSDLYFTEAINLYLKDIIINPNDNGLLYDLACLKSLTEKKQEALKYFELSLQNGWKDFDHIKKDTDLDFIRDTKEFKELINKYNNH
ncbi:MAG: caspase family protein [Bacteroidetes bacterium]|nr:caspase family protein [Bacteroidota bacterium]